ncbi:hypothetical protein WA171_004907 [Blastocystis sp. BT1]
MGETKAVLFNITNPVTLAKEQDLKSVYEFYCSFPEENRFAEIEKAKGGVDPTKTVIFKSTVYIILTNKECVKDIIDRCIVSNYTSVALDAIKKCLGYYRELGPDSRVAMMQAFNTIYSTQFPYICRMTPQLLSLSQCCYISQSNMWLTQRILDCLEPNIAGIIANAKTQNETLTVPTILLWCLRKCYDHVFIAPDFSERESLLIQKIYTLDRDGFLRCGVDSLFFLHILRMYQPSIKSFYQLLLQDTPYVQSLLGTTASVDFYALSPESEIKRNIETFYTGIHEQKRLDGTVIQGLLHGLLIYKNSNTIWNSAVITVLRLCLLKYGSETITDTVIDYCVQYVRLITMPASASNQRVTNRDVIDALFLLLLIQLQTSVRDIFTRYITQTTNLKSDHGINVIELIRMGLRLAVSSQTNPIILGIFSFFKTSVSQQPSQTWWDSNLLQFPLDVQNLLMQLKSSSIVQPTLIQPESKRQRIEGEESNEGLTAESRQMLSVLEKYSKDEMKLYLVSIHEREDYRIASVIGLYYDHQGSCLFSDSLSQAVSELLIENDSILRDLLSHCRSSCSLLDYWILTELLRGAMLKGLEDIPVINRQNDLISLQRILYDYYAIETNPDGEALASKVLALFTEDGKGFGDILEGILSSSLILDMLRSEEEESSVIFVILFVIPFCLKFLRKQLRIVPVIRYLCAHMEISFVIACILPSR